MYSPRIIAANREKLDRARHAAGKAPLREYSLSEVRLFEDALAKIGWPEGQTSNVVASLPREAQEYIENNYLLSQIDFRYWAERYCYISTSDATLDTLVLRPSQQKILAKWGEMEESAMPLPRGKVGLIVAKARRAGATVIAQSAVAHGVLLRPQAAGLTASDIPENTLKLFQIQERILDNLPKWMMPSIEGGKVKADHLRFRDLDSDLGFATGNQKSPMNQGVRGDFIHFTEVSTWERPDQIDDDVLPGFLGSGAPTCLFILESTGKGGKGNWFYQQYQDAKAKKGYFRHAFISWYHIPELHSLPDATGVEIGTETQRTLERIKRETGFECSKGQAAWYEITKQQFESKGKLDDFLQEYPSTDEECFQFGTRSAFSIELRMKMRDECRTPVGVLDWNPASKTFTPVPRSEWQEKDPSERDPINRLILWELARPGFLYLLAADASVGLEGGDNAAVEVLRVGNRAEGPEQVAEFAGSVDPLTFADVIQYIGFLYPDKDLDLPCKAIVEITGPGLGTQLQLQRLGYGNYYTHRRPLDARGGQTQQLGFQTNVWTREAVTTLGVEVFKKRAYKVNSPFMIEEMSTYGRVLNKAGTKRTYDHAPLCHDDRLMATFIAMYVAAEPDQIFLAEEAGRYAAPETKAIGGALPDPQSIATWHGEVVTSESMWRLWENIN